ncbi:MAG: G1 family glutamic endopeptidase [Candidatus Limnocylindrales bacterium]
MGRATGILVLATILAACGPAPGPTGRATGSPTEGPSAIATVAQSSPLARPSAVPSATFAPSSGPGGSAAFTPLPSPSPPLLPSASPSPSPSSGPASVQAGCPATALQAGPSAGQRSLHVATTNWAGYVTRSSQALTCVQGDWTQPSLTCPASGSASLSIWIGFDGESGVSGSSLEQVGTNADCINGRARLFAWFEILPRDPFERFLDLDVSAGDRIAASIDIVGRSYHLVIENLTSGSAIDTYQHAPGSHRLTAEWIVEAPSIGCPDDCHVAPLPRFSTVTFSAAAAVLAGRTGPIEDARWTRVQVTLETARGTIRARPGGLAHGGAGFVVVWHHV